MSRVYDQWLDSRKHESDEFEHEFEMRTERHLQTDWNPENYETFLDALFDADLKPYESRLKEAVKKGHLGALDIGTIIVDMVHDYCEDKAKQLAKEEMGKS
jgi:regulator of sigma D